MRDPEVPRVSGLPPWAAAAAFAGGTLWAVKALAILIADDQPAYMFEMAPFFFGIATLGVALVWETNQIQPRRRVRAFAIAASISGAVSALASVAGLDEVVFGPALMISALSTIGVLLYTGRTLRKTSSLGRWSNLPWIIGWLFVAAIPVGGVLENINERLLEVPLLAISLAWIVLSTSMFAAFPRTTRVA